MRRRGLVWASMVLGLLAAGGSAAWWRLGPVTVETGQPSRGTAVQAVYATGTVEPTVMLPLASRSMGRLMELRVDEGAQVRAGQILARLEDADLQRSVDELTARAQFAKTQYDRAQELLDRKLGSVLERDQARAEWRAAEAAADRARALQSFMTLTAPADGQILRRDGEVGQMIPANQAIFYFSRHAPLRIEAEVDEEDILLVQPGQSVLIRAPALPDQVLEGQVAAITPKGDAVNRSFRVRIEPKGESPLRIGMTVEVNIIVTERPDALLVPATAVVDSSVWTVRAGRLQHHPVQVGISGELKIEIISGLTESETIVVRPGSGLQDGQRVRATPVLEPAVAKDR